MARKTSLVANINGNPYQVDIKIKGSKYEVAVNGQPVQTYKVGTYSYWMGHVEDFPLVIDGQELFLAVRKRKIRLASGGVYLDDGSPYYPAPPLPGWYWLFLILNLAILVLYIVVGIIPGALPIALSLAGAAFCGSIARNPTMGMPVKILVCVLITAAVWAVLVGLGFAAIMLAFA